MPARTGTRARDDEEFDFSAREAMRTRAFWLLSLGHAMGLITVGAMLVHFVSHVTEELDISLGAAARMSTLMTVLLVVGMVSAGWLGDRVSKRAIIVAAMEMHLVAMLMIALASSLLLVTLAAVLRGAAWGARGPLTQALRAGYFGTASFRKIMGFSSLIVMMGVTVGPLAASVLYDQTGSYTPGFLVLALASAIGALCFLFATKPEPPRRASAPRRPDLTRRVSTVEIAPPVPAGGRRLSRAFAGGRRVERLPSRACVDTRADSSWRRCSAGSGLAAARLLCFVPPPTRRWGFTPPGGSALRPPVAARDAPGAPQHRDGRR